MKERAAPIAERAAEPVVATTPYGTFAGPAEDLITRQLLEFGGHTRNELAMLLRFVRPGDVVLDVGGHIGTFAVPLGALVGREGRVFAFEPSPESHDLLRRNVEQNGLQEVVRIERAAAGDVEETLRCHRVPGNSGATFLSREENGEAVRTVVLDEWWDGGARGEGRTVSLVKVDTEGMEARVLRGAEEILRHDRPILYLEYSPRNLARAGSSAAELEELLRSHGYHCFTNLGPRNSSSDDFALGRIASPSHVGPFGDLLCFHPASRRYPAYFAGPLWSWTRLRWNEAKAPWGGAVRRARRALPRH